MKIRFLFYFIALFSGLVNAQEIMEREHVFIKNLNSLYQNPSQTIKVADYLFDNATSSSEKAQALFLLSKSKMLQGNTAAGVENLFRAREILKENKSPFISSLVLIALSERCRMSGMDDIASKYLKLAENFSQKIDSESESEIAKSGLLLEQAKTLESTNNSEKKIQKLKKAETFPNLEYPALKAIIANEIGNHYLSVLKIDSASIYFNKAISILKKSGLDHSSLKSTSLNGLGKIQFLNNDFEAAKQYFNSALLLPMVEKATKVATLENLSEVYKKQDSVALSQKYYNKKSILNTSVIDSERKVRSVIISHIDAEQQTYLLSDERGYLKWGAFLAGLFLFTFVGYYFYNRKLNREYKRFKEVIAQVEKDEKLQAPFSINDTSLKPSKGVVIPKETEKLILERLDEFEKSTKFTNSNMNLTLLAKQLKTNSKYISEIIHTHKQKNFSTYINELRVNYIIQLMKTDKTYLTYKVSYLAETSGFSSHSAFTVVFKSITGFTPKQFISFLKKSGKEKSATF